MKIDMKPYNVKVQTESGISEKPYCMHMSLCSLLFYSETPLAPEDVVVRGELCDYIDSCGDELVLDDVQKEMVLQAFKKYPNYSRYDLEFVRRIQKAQ